MQLCHVSWKRASRQADREGYPDLAETFKRYALEEAEHAAKFAELLGEVVTNSTNSSKGRRQLPKRRHGADYAIM